MKIIPCSFIPVPFQVRCNILFYGFGGELLPPSALEININNSGSEAEGRDLLPAAAKFCRRRQPNYIIISSEGSGKRGAEKRELATFFGAKRRAARCTKLNISWLHLLRYCCVCKPRPLKRHKRLAVVKDALLKHSVLLLACHLATLALSNPLTFLPISATSAAYLPFPPSPFFLQQQPSNSLTRNHVMRSQGVPSFPLLPKGSSFFCYCYILHV